VWNVGSRRSRDAAQLWNGDLLLSGVHDAEETKSRELAELRTQKAQTKTQKAQPVYAFLCAFCA